MIKAFMEDNELGEHIGSLEKDEMAVFVMADGRVRGALFHGSRFVNQARAQHNLGILETMAFGQAALCGALLIPTMKGREHLAWRYECDGPAAGFSVEADSSGYVRGFPLVQRIPVEKPLDSWNLAPFLGDGTMTMTRSLEGGGEPHTSSVEILYRNITKDLAWYFQQSEQIQTAFNTSIFMDERGRVRGAGGMFLQIMPETGGTRPAGSRLDSGAGGAADAGLIEKVEDAFSAAPSLGKWFSEGGNLDDMIHGLFREFEPQVAVRRSVLFDCPCSRDSILSHLRRLPRDEVEDMRLNGPNPMEIVCRNCGSVYRIPVEEI